MTITKYENMRLLFLDFIDTASDEIDEEAWKDKLTTLDELLSEVKRLREALIAVQQSLVWDEKDRTMDGDPITLEALVTQVEQVRSDITEMIE